MTRRLYYEDPFLREFEAAVIRTRTQDGVRWAALDRSAFFPGGGGQPADCGILDGFAVNRVEDAEGILWHAVEGALETGRTVRASIDWERRFDHMQQHTGQHILSAAFLETAGAETRSFHMGEAHSTIDVAHPGPDAATIARVEDRANAVIWEDREVATHVVPRSEAERFPLRKPPAFEGEVRIVEVKDFDWSACGGTHVRRAGQVGAIAVIGTERYKGGTRVAFACGARALRHHRESARLVREAAAPLSVGPPDLPGAVARLKEEGDRRERRLRALLREALEREAESLLAQAPRGAAGPVVAQHFADREPEEVAVLGGLIAARGGIALLFAGGDPIRAHFSAPTGTLSMTELLGSVCRRHGGKGGGRAESAQGAVPPSGLPAALEDASRLARSGNREGMTP